MTLKQALSIFYSTALFAILAVGIAVFIGEVRGDGHNQSAKCKAWAETISIDQACAQQVQKCILTTQDLRQLVEASDGLKTCGVQPTAAHKPSASGTESL